MTIEKSNILDILNAEGIELSKKGNYFWALCPLHDEKTPSFSVDPERQTFRCFGECSEGGDVIAFIQKYRGLSFKDSLAYLGISGKDGKSLGWKPDPRIFRKRKLIKGYEQWLEDYERSLAFLLRMAWRIKKRLKTIETVESWSWLYHEEPKWKYHLDILAGNDEREKFSLYKRLRYDGKI